MQASCYLARMPPDSASSNPRIVLPPLGARGDMSAIPERAFVERATATGTGTRVWLVRHAEVHADWHEKAYGNTDVPLSTEGEADTRAMGAAFAGRKLARVTSSDLARALAMGRAIADSSGAELVLEPRLREIWRGAWQGLPAAEFRARWSADAERFAADPWTWKGHGGESDAEVCARAWPVLADAVARSEGGETVLAAHYNVIRVLVTRAVGLGARASFSFRNDPARATLLVDEPAGWRVVVANAERP